MQNMFIKRVVEGSKLSFGLNWMSTERTLFSLKVKIPYWIYYAKEHDDFDTGNLIQGFRCCVFLATFRLRRMKHFSKNVRKIIWHFNQQTQQIGKQNIILTEEEIADQVVKQMLA